MPATPAPACSMPRRVTALLIFLVVMCFLRVVAALPGLLLVGRDRPSLPASIHQGADGATSCCADRHRSGCRTVRAVSPRRIRLAARQAGEIIRSTFGGRCHRLASVEDT